MMRPDLPAVACVLGPGGIGKSNLCLSALHAKDVKEKFGKRRAFVRCDAATGRESLIKFIAEEIGVAIGPNLEDRVLDELERAPAVVVLDNFESPWELEPGEVETFLSVLAGIEHLAVVVGVRGQQRPGVIAYREVIEIETLSPEHAAEVFLNVGGKKFATDPALQPLLREMDYLPLAVELLAYRAQTETSLSRLEKSWREKKSEILKRADAKDRQTNLAVSVELSFESPRMTEDAKKLASLLGVLPNGISDEDLPAVLGNEGDEAARVLRAVGLAFSENGRMRVLVPVLEYLAENYILDEKLLSISRAFFSTIGIICGGQIGFEGSSDSIKRIWSDYENIAAMIEADLKTSDWKSGSATARGLASFSQSTGQGDERILELACEKARGERDWEELARCIECVGDLSFARADFNKSQIQFEEAKLLYERVGSLKGQASCLKCLGDIALIRRNHQKAFKRYSEAKLLFEQVGDELGLASCLERIGDIAFFCSDNTEARMRFDEAEQLFERVGSVLGKANCIRNHGLIAKAEGNLDKAREYFFVAHASYERVGDSHSIGTSHFLLASITIGDERASHIAAAREAWTSIDRPDLVALLDKL